MQEGQNGVCIVGREGSMNLEGSLGSDVLTCEPTNCGGILSVASAVIGFERKGCGAILNQDESWGRS